MPKTQNMKLELIHVSPEAFNKLITEGIEPELATETASDEIEYVITNRQRLIPESELNDAHARIEELQAQLASFRTAIGRLETAELAALAKLDEAKVDAARLRAALERIKDERYICGDTGCMASEVARKVLTPTRAPTQEGEGE